MAGMFNSDYTVLTFTSNVSLPLGKKAEQLVWEFAASIQGNFFFLRRQSGRGRWRRTKNKLSAKARRLVDSGPAARRNRANRAWGEGPGEEVREREVWRSGGGRVWWRKGPKEKVGAVLRGS